MAQVAAVTGVKKQWQTKLCSCCEAGTGMCLLSFAGCAQCVLANALMEWEGGGGGECCFHCLCTDPALARVVMRESYQIKGKPGWDCLIGTCLPCFNAAQLLAHVRKAGKPNFPVTNEVYGKSVGNWGGMRTHCGGAVCYDPIHMCGLWSTVPCTSASLAAGATSIPFWLFYRNGNYCANHHILRLNYGVHGTTCWDDCFEPIFCCLLGGIVPCWACLYFTQMLENERKYATLAAEHGAPTLFFPSTTDVHIAYPQPPKVAEGGVVDGSVVVDQPTAADGAYPPAETNEDQEEQPNIVASKT